MKTPVVIFAANGFLGRYLCRHFARQGREVVAVGRSRDGWSGDGMFLEWDGRTIGPWALALEGAGLVINLAGRSVDCRHDEQNQREIMDSRVDSTGVIGEAIARCQEPPRLWMNASTATWYRHAEDQPQDEWKGEPGDGFSCQVAQAWEQAFFDAAVAGTTRKLALRIGMVLANEAGTVLDVFSKLVRWGLGGRMGNGRQRVSWIHMEDLLAAIDHLEADTFADGVYNLSSPLAATNAELMCGLRGMEGMPLGLPTPRWALEVGARLLRTEAELVLKSLWVVPARLEAAEFRFRWSQLDAALHDLRERQGLEGFFHVPELRAMGARVWTSGRRLSSA